MAERHRLGRTPLLVLLGVFVAASLSAVPASAHDSTSGSIVLEVNDERIIASGPIPFEELGYRDTSGDGLIDTEELRAQEAGVSSSLVAVVRSKVALGVDGQDLQIIGAGVPGLTSEGGDAAAETASADTAGSAFVALMFVTGPHDGDVSHVTLDWAFDSPSTEVVLSSPNGVVTGGLGDDDAVAFSLGAWASVSSFFALGIEHIRFGPDHLLFLVVLTLAVAGSVTTKSSTWRTVKLVTAFTVGHAISLCLAYFDLISVPSSLVEPAISLSIVAAAILVMRGRTDEARPWIVAIIGVVHGLGFASSLASLGVATSQRATALAAFNVGIDVAQTTVVLMIVAALGLCSMALADRSSADRLAIDQPNSDRMAWVRVPTAAIAAVIGLAWTATRISSVVL